MRKIVLGFIFHCERLFRSNLFLNGIFSFSREIAASLGLDTLRYSTIAPRNEIKYQLLNNPALQSWRAGYVIQLSASSLNRSRDHVFQQNLKRHRMSAALMSNEELAVTLKAAFAKCYMMRVIITVKGQVELVEAKAIPLFGITLGFFDLSDHSRIHLSISFRI
jgi:hypothetical protein